MRGRSTLKVWMVGLGVSCMMLLASRAGAQDASAHAAAGDRLFVARDAHGALREYELAITADPMHYDALCKASRTGGELGAFEPVAAAPRAPCASGPASAERDRGDLEGARMQYDWIARAPLVEPNDAHDQQQAATERRKL